jgi:hypothetical protein
VASHVGSAAGLEPLQLVQRLAAHLDPGAVREVGVDGLRQMLIGSRWRPCSTAPAALEPAVGHAEHGAAEEQQQRYLAIVQAGEVPGRADLQVVAEHHRQVKLDAAGEAGDHDRHVGELQRPERLGPALRFAEEVVQPLGLGGGVAPPARLDPDLAAQRDGLDPLAAGVIDAQRERHGRSHRVPVGMGPEAVEDELGHVRSFSLKARDRMRTCPRNSAMLWRASAPPSTRASAGASGLPASAGVDRHEEVLHARVRAAEIRTASASASAAASSGAPRSAGPRPAG